MKKILTLTFATVFLTASETSAADRNEKTVFITGKSFISNLGGLAGADEKCQAEADTSTSIVPSGSYMAWLSDGTDSPDTRFTKSPHPYVLSDGTKIAEDFTDLTDGSIQHFVNIGSTGKPVGQKLFWSSTKPDGTSAQKFVTCEGWTWTKTSTTISHSMVGITTRKTTLWSMYSREQCGRSYRLVCFQQ
jgi:hypothetical protein